MADHHGGQSVGGLDVGDHRPGALGQCGPHRVESGRPSRLARAGHRPTAGRDLGLELAAPAQQRLRGSAVLLDRVQRLDRLPQLGTAARRRPGRPGDGSAATGWTPPGLARRPRTRRPAAGLQREGDAEFGEPPTVHRRRGAQVDAAELAW